MDDYDRIAQKEWCVDSVAIYFHAIVVNLQQSVFYVNNMTIYYMFGILNKTKSHIFISLELTIFSRIPRKISCLLRKEKNIKKYSYFKDFFLTNNYNIVRF